MNIGEGSYNKLGKSEDNKTAAALILNLALMKAPQCYCKRDITVAIVNYGKGKIFVNHELRMVLFLRDNVTAICDRLKMLAGSQNTHRGNVRPIPRQ